MNKLPNCKKCNSKYTYKDAYLIVCPECAYEWNPNIKIENKTKIYKDAYGNNLENGDSVTVIKDLKIKGSSDILKRGTIVKNIQLKDGNHDVDCKIQGFGNMELKTEFLKRI